MALPHIYGALPINLRKPSILMMQITPRGYQQDTVDKDIDAFERGVKRQLNVMSTGTGKTYTACFLRDQFKPNKQTVFMVDEIQLAYQAKDSFLNADPSLDVGIEMNKHRCNPEKDDVIITSVPTIGRKGSRRIKRLIPENMGLVVVDEAHKSVSESWTRTLDYLQVGPNNFNSQKLLLGLTATPNRPDGKPLSILYDDITQNLDTRWAVQNGWLTEFEFYRVDTDTDISNVRKNRGKFNQKQLDEAVNNENRNAQIFKAYKEFSDGERAIVFGASVDHCILLADLFTKNGVEARCIHANTPKHKRKEWIAQYKAGEIKVLSNYGTLTTGFDAPDTTTIMLARPIASQLLYQQIIGRGLRPSKDSMVDLMNSAGERKLAMEISSKPYAKIIDFHDVTSSKDVVSPASLFGLHPDLKVKQGQKFFKDVVEKLEEVKHEHNIDIAEIDNLDDIELQVKRKKANLSSVMDVPEEIQLHSNKAWAGIGDDNYELTFTSDRVVLIVSKNQLDMWDVKKYDMDSHETETLNTFGSLSGAVNTADKYADQNLDNTFVEQEEWEDDGVTKGQFKYLKQFLSHKGLKVDYDNRYHDTHVPKLHFSGELLNKGRATRLLQKLFNR